MAFLIRSPKSKYFIARFIDLDGKRRNRSTRSTSRTAAQKIANAYEDAANKRRSAKQVRDVIAELHKEVSGDDIKADSFRVFADNWIIRKTPEVKLASMAFYKNAIAKFTDFLGGKAGAEMTTITADDIVRFRNHEAKTLSPKTVNHDLKALRMMFRDALRDRVISESPCEFVNTTKKSQTKKKLPFTIPQLQAVLAAADEEWQSMIRFGLYTGQRIGDIATLTWQSVDLERRRLRLVQQKTSKPVILPLPPQMVARLESVPRTGKPDEPLHPRAFASWARTGKSASLSNQFADLLAKANLRERKSHKKSTSGLGRKGARTSGGLGFHCLRSTMITLGAELGIPKEVIMAIAGHDSEAMSQHYTNVGETALDNALAAFPIL